MFVKVKCPDCDKDIWIDLGFDVTKTREAGEDNITVCRYTIDHIDVISCITDQDLKKHIKKDIVFLQNRDLNNDELAAEIGKYYSIGRLFVGDLVRSVLSKNKSKTIKVN